MQRSVRAVFRSIVHAVWIGLTGGLLTASGATADTLWIDRLGDTIPRGIAVEYDGATTLAMARASGSLAEPVYELYQFAHGGELRWRVDLKVDSRFAVTTVSPFGVEQTIKTNDESLTFWRLAMRDGDPLHRNLVSLPQTGAGGIILGDSLLGLWRIGADGRAYWHRPLAPSFGLSLTEMASFADGLILVGGLSAATGGACASAAVMQIDDYGFTKWRWQFDGHRGTYPIRLVPWPSGMTLALITTGHGNRYVASWGDTPCGGRKVDGEWLVWLNPDGTTARIIEMPRELFVLGIAAFADGRAVVAAWGPRELLFRIYGPAGGEVVAERAFDRWRDFGWSRDANVFGRFEMQTTADRVQLTGTIGCDPKSYWTWPCPGQGWKLLELTPDLRLRTMPATIDWDWWVAHGAWNSFELVRPVLRGSFNRIRE